MGRTCGRLGPEALRANSLGLWKLTKGRVRAHTHDISALQLLFVSRRLLLEPLGGKAREERCLVTRSHTPGEEFSPGHRWTSRIE